MTGFGRAEAQVPLGHFAVEIKSVNSRFLEAKAYLPPSLSGLEAELRALIQKKIRRGKVDCRVRFTPAPGQARPAQFNEALIEDYAEKLSELQGLIDPQGRRVGIETILRLPGAFEVPGDANDLDAHWAELKKVVHTALEAFDEEREREGDALRTQIQEELNLLRSRLAAIDGVKSAVVTKFRDRLMARIAELSEEVRGKLDPGRLELEVTLYADRCDISEELVRLDSHFDRLETLITRGDKTPVGKALDFLLQEILREVNTTSSKLRDLEAVSAVLDMKSSIERVKEQIQNIE
jgi:uncharacterized protein (TIGR00255 family)